MSSTIQPPKQDKKKGSKTARRKKRSEVSFEDATREEDSNTNQSMPKKDKGKRTPTTRKSTELRKELIPEVEKAVENFVMQAAEIGVEGMRKMYRDLLQNYTPPPDLYKFKAFEANPTRNRYADVVCLDETRVKLTLDVPPMTDYIHANWVKFEKHDRMFIATQGPLDNTIEDFWRMIFQENCPTIVNLTKNIEEGKVKCSQYWPTESGGYKTFGKMFINNKKTEEEDKFTIYTLEVLPEGCSNSIIVKLIHVTFWPDKGIPLSGLTVLRLIRLITSTDKLATGPVVVHCSAGIGRSGTIIFIDIILHKLFKQSVNIDMMDIFKQLRHQRASAVQQEGQFVFIVSSILDYVKARAPKYKDIVEKFKEDFKASNLASN